MKWMFAAVAFLSVGALAACSGKGSNTTGSGGGGGEDEVTTSQASSSSSGTGGAGQGGGAQGGGGQGGQGGGSATPCDNSGTCMTCTSCAQKPGAACNDEAAAFQMTPNWMVFYQCITPCVQLPADQQKACLDPCCMANQPECQAYGMFTTCIACDQCYNDCNGAMAMCPP
jgi:hypothetical protein